MPGVCCTVGEQIESLRRIAGDKVASRDPPRAGRDDHQIVDGWAQRIDAKRARGSASRPKLVRRIIRTHIDDELGGKIAA